MRPFKFCIFIFIVSLRLGAQGQTAQQEPPALSGESDLKSAGAPVNPDFASGRRLLQQGKYDEALSALQSLRQKNPKVIGLNHEIGLAYYKKGDYLKAAESFTQALREKANDAEAEQLLGLSYYLGGRPGQAIRYLEKVQGWYPSANVDAAYILGICYIQTKDYPHARVAFSRMFDVPQDSGASYLFTARMLLRQEFDPVAEEYAKKAVALDPQLPLAHFLLGELYLYESRIAEAITEFKKELAINPANANVYYKLADAYSRAQKFEDAERLLQRSIWLDASSTGPYILMGQILEKKGEFELAEHALKHAAAMDPNNSITHHLLGQTYRDLGRAEDADRELKIAEQLQEGQDNKQ